MVAWGASRYVPGVQQLADGREVMAPVGPTSTPAVRGSRNRPIYTGAPPWAATSVACFINTNRARFIHASDALSDRIRVMRSRSNCIGQ